MIPDQNVRERLTNTIFVTQSLFSATQIAVATLVAIVAVEITGVEGFAGFPSTTMTLTQAATAVPLGLLMSRLGRRFGLTASYAISALGGLLGVIAVMQSSFWLLLLSSAMFGAGRAGGEQSRYAAGDMFLGGYRARMIGRVVFAGTIGAIFGPLLVVPSGFLAERFGMLDNAGPWLIGMAFSLIAAGITLFFLNPDPLSLSVTDDQQVDKTTPPRATRSVRQLLAEPHVQLAVLSMLISQLVMVALMVITPVHMGHHEMGKGSVSIVIMAHTIGMFGLSGFTGYLVDRFGVHTTMLLGAATLIASAVISPLSATMPYLVVGLFLLGLGWNFCYIAGSSLLSAGLDSAERGQIQGTSDMFVAGAAAIGSIISGPIFGLGKFTAVAGVTIVIVALFLFAVRVLQGRIAAREAASPVGVVGD